MTATLEERFNGALTKWKQHCRSKSHFSFAQPYLDSEAYKEIVSIGVSSLPLIRDQLNQEIEADERYDNELKRLKIKVFGTDQVRLFDDNYRKICEDGGYRDYQRGYDLEIVGNPGQFWAYVVREIVGDNFKIETKEDNTRKVSIAGEFFGIDVRRVKQLTLKWLNENIQKYLQQ